MTVRQAADRLEISPSLVYSLIQGGKLRYARIGNGRGEDSHLRGRDPGIPRPLHLRADGGEGTRKAA